MQTIIASGVLCITPNTLDPKPAWIVSLTIPAGAFRLECLSPAANISEAQAMAEVSTRLWCRAGHPKAADAGIPVEVWQWARDNRDACWAAGDSVFPKPMPLRAVDWS